MKLDHLLMAITLAMLAVIGAALLIPEIQGGHGVPHPDFPSMLRGGSGPERHAQILWIGWSLGLLQIAFFVSLMIFGSRKRGAHRGAARPLLYCAAVHAATWTWLVLSYRSFMNDGSPSLFLALPGPTAILVYGLWPLQALFTLCFVIGFPRWVLSDDDLASFDRLVAARRQRLGNSPDVGPEGGRDGHPRGGPAGIAGDGEHR